MFNYEFKLVVFVLVLGTQTVGLIKLAMDKGYNGTCSYHFDAPVKYIVPAYPLGCWLSTPFENRFD
jgi:hypothetical protein